VAALVVGLLVCFSAAVRVHTALADPAFDSGRAEGLMKSDPALLFYVTGRIVEAGGLPPADFRADPRVQHPGPTDVPAEFTVGQEFLVAWAALGARALGLDAPLHLVALWVMSIVASLAVVGVALLARAVSGGWGAALVAAGLFVVMPANYRTIGFVLVREDLALPLFALHLGLAGRARTPAGWLAAGLAAGAALATWHAMRFVFALELACLALWFLRSGRSPFSRPVVGAGRAAVLVGPVRVGPVRVGPVLVGPVLAAVLVPALREQALLLSLPMALAFGRAAAALVPSRGKASAVAAGVAAGVLGAGSLVGGGEGYGHVWAVLLAKLAHGGVFPDGADDVPFDARLLWQGPFETIAAGAHAAGHVWVLLLSAPALLVGARAWWSGRGAGAALLLAGLVAGCGAAWLAERMVVLPGLLLPVLAVSGRAGWPRALPRTWSRGLTLLALALQLLAFSSWVREHVQPWYRPAVRQVGENLAPDEPVVGDFMNSTAVLAHTGRPIVLQPKYETERSRRRAEAFLVTFFQRSPAELRELVRGPFAARTLLIDRYTLWGLSRRTAGLAADELEPRPGTAAALLLDPDPLRLEESGFTLLYRSPSTLLGPNGEPSDFFRLYRVDG